jgi:hypothetical protein
VGGWLHCQLVMWVCCSGCCLGYAAAVLSFCVPDARGGGVVAGGLQPSGEQLCML